MTESISIYGRAVKLSIITIHLNNFFGFERTLNSLVQVLKDARIEWIVIDGGSQIERDENFILDKARPLANHFVSEPDDGIYDAMNKGTQLAVGQYVLYLNAGDELHPEFQFEQFSNTSRSGSPSMIWGRYEVRDQRETIYPRKTRHPAWLRYGTAVCHQAVFFNRSLLGNEPYNTDLQIAADYDLICRLYTAGEEIASLDTFVCIFDLIGESGSNKRLTLLEESKVRRKYFPVTGTFNLLINSFKLGLWHLGTLSPSFRRAWSRYF